MLRESKLHSSAVAFCVMSATGIACAGEVEDPGYTHVIAPTEVVRFQADASLQSIQDVAVAASGEIWALQRKREPHLFVFSADGNLHDSFGTTGSERNQLRNPYTLLPSDDSSFPMAVWDAGNRRISLFNPYGRASSIQVSRSRGQVYAEIENHSYGSPLKMARLGDSYLLLDHSNGLHVTVDYLRSELLRLNRDGDLVDTLVDFKRDFADSIAGLGREVRYLAPIPLWGTCPDDEMVLFEPFTRTLRWYDVEGRVVARDMVPIPVRQITEDDQSNFLRHRFELQWREQRSDEPDSSVVENSVENFMRRHRDQFSAKAPSAVGLMCGGGREVWLREFSTGDDQLGLGARWLVHSHRTADRVYVRFPDGFRPIRIVDGRAYGALTLGESAEVAAYVALPENIAPPDSEVAH